MDFYDFWYNLKKDWWVILLLVVLIAGLAFTLSMIQTLKYQSETRVLVGHKTDTTDESIEYLSNLLGEMVQTSSFMDLVLINKDVIDNFSDNALARKEEWLKTVDTEINEELGIITIRAYHTNQKQAVELAQTIANVLVVKGTLYHGQGNKVFTKQVDQVVVTNYPVKPNIILNTVLGLVIGLI